MIVVKHKFIPGRGPRSGGKVVAIGKALAHMKYIQHRPGPDREKGGRELFNERDDLDARDMREAVKRLGGNRVIVHKLTLSPEINVANKKEFTREVMKDLSRDKGLDLEWFGTEHNNTDHHHIHVVVLGKDRNGTDVRIDMKDIDKMHGYGDRYLERWHPRELERSRKEREEKERNRRQERTESRETATRERAGAELPWMHKKLVREQIEPYKDWAEKKKREETDRSSEAEKPLYHDTIEAAGKEWSKANNLDELRSLNTYLWDNIEERIPKKDYKKLQGWIKDKERVKDEISRESIQSGGNSELISTPESGKEKPGRKESEKRESDEIEYKGEKYKKHDPYEKLTGLVKKTREEEERLPFDDYQKLRTWVEDADRARFSGALEKQLELTHKKFERSRTMEQLKEMEGGRVLVPAQEEMLRNPIVGLFLKVASVSNELVRSIPLDDRLRDPLKEGRDELEAGKKGIDDRELERNKRPTSEMSREQLLSLQGSEKKDRDNREKIEKDIEGNKKAKERELRQQKKAREKADRERREPYDTFDPWGMY